MTHVVLVGDVIGYWPRCWSLISGYTGGMAIRALRFRQATLIALALLWYPINSSLAQDVSENLILVTLDGVRWQEVFSGVDMRLIEDERFTSEPEYLTQTYWREQRSERRRALFPIPVVQSPSENYITFPPTLHNSLTPENNSFTQEGGTYMST